MYVDTGGEGREEHTHTQMLRNCSNNSHSNITVLLIIVVALGAIFLNIAVG